MTFSKKTRPVTGAVEDLGERELGLQDGDVVAVAGRAVGGGEGVREAAQPLAGQGVEAGRGEAIAERLGTARVGAEEQAVVERLEGDARASRIRAR
jgi:hypothetical protein